MPLVHPEGDDARKVLAHAAPIAHPHAPARRLMFEAGRQVMPLVHPEDDKAREVLAHMLLHSMGPEVGGLLTGRFGKAIQVRGCVCVCGYERACVCVGGCG